MVFISALLCPCLPSFGPKIRLPLIPPTSAQGYPAVKVYILTLPLDAASPLSHCGVTQVRSRTPPTTGPASLLLPKTEPFHDIDSWEVLPLPLQPHRKFCFCKKKKKYPHSLPFESSFSHFALGHFYHLPPRPPSSCFHPNFLFLTVVAYSHYLRFYRRVCVLQKQTSSFHVLTSKIARFTLPYSDLFITRRENPPKRETLCRACDFPYTCPRHSRAIRKCAVRPSGQVHGTEQPSLHHKASTAGRRSTLPPHQRRFTSRPPGVPENSEPQNVGYYR